MLVREGFGGRTGSWPLLLAPHHPLTPLWADQLQAGAPVTPVARQGPADAAYLQGVGCGWEEPAELMLKDAAEQGAHLVGEGLALSLDSWCPPSGPAQLPLPSATPSQAREVALHLTKVQLASPSCGW